MLNHLKALMSSNQKKAYFFASLTIIFWSTSASAFKISLGYTDIIHLLFYSSTTAAIALSIVNIIRQTSFKATFHKRKNILTSIILGLLNPFLYYIILFKAFALIPAQQAQPLNFVWPLMIVFLSILLLKQKIKKHNILALLISFLGVIVISTKGSFNLSTIDNPLGVFLAIFSSLIWATFFILNLKDERDELEKLNLSFISGSMFSFILLITTNSSLASNYQALLGGIYIGLFEMALAFFFWSKALKYSVNTAKVSNLIFLTPFLSLLCINYLVRENITFSTFIGLSLIIAGISIERLFQSDKSQKNI